MNHKTAKEVLRSGDIVSEDGDILPAADFSKDEYPEDSNILKELRAVEDYGLSLHFGALAKRGHRNPETRKAGGVEACRRQRLDAYERAHRSYLSSKDINIIHDPGLGAPSEAIDEYFEGVQLWMGFKEAMSHPDTRLSRLDELREILRNQKTS